VNSKMIDMLIIQFLTPCSPLDRSMDRLEWPPTIWAMDFIGDGRIFPILRVAPEFVHFLQDQRSLRYCQVAMCFSHVSFLLAQAQDRQVSKCLTEVSCALTFLIPRTPIHSELTSCAHSSSMSQQRDLVAEYLCLHGRLLRPPYFTERMTCRPKYSRSTRVSTRRRAAYHLAPNRADWLIPAAMALECLAKRLGVRQSLVLCGFSFLSSKTRAGHGPFVRVSVVNPTARQGTLSP